MATLRNSRKLVTVRRDNLEEHLRNNQSRNTAVLGIQEDYITQFWEGEIEGRVTKKLSQEFSKIESWILNTLPKLDEFLLPTSQSAICNRFGNIREFLRKKPGTEWGPPFPEWSLSWSRYLRQSKFGPSWGVNWHQKIFDSFEKQRLFYISIEYRTEKT